MPRTRTTKKLAQRIDLDYFKRPSPLRRWRFLLSIAAPALAILWIAWYGVRGDRRVYSAGGLSTAHAVLTKQCSACHVSTLGFYDAKVIDQKCLTRAMMVPCITPRKRSRPRALPATPTIGERFDLPQRTTRIVRSVTRTSRRTRVPPVLSTTLAVLKAIIPNSPCCDRSGATREPFSSTITSIWNQIFSGRMAAACKWGAPTVTVRQVTPAARGPMGIQKTKQGFRKIHLQ